MTILTTFPFKIKLCKKCGEEKTLTEFYRHKGMSDGHLNICKSCKRDYATNTYKPNPEYESKRNRLPHRVKARRLYYERMKDTKEYKDRRKSHAKSVNFCIKRRANVKWGNYVRDNNILPGPCSVCGLESKKNEAHHEDYNLPLDIVWMCKRCHSERHIQINFDIKVLGIDYSHKGF